MKIGYFADGPWAHRAFEKLITDTTIEICFICVRNDYKDPVLMDLGKQYGIDVIYSPNINSEEFIKQISIYQVDLFVSMSFNQIFRKHFYEIPPLKTINCHAGKLPLYRGRNILNWALINDEKEFGITVHYVDEGIDTGDIIVQEVYPITDEDTYATLLERAYEGCADVLYKGIKKIQNNDVTRIHQKDIDPVGMYCGMRKQGDEILDWNQTSREIFNFVRAICKPGPQAHTWIGDELMRINEVRMIAGAHNYKGIPGQVLGKSENGFYVKTSDTMLEVVDYEYAGRIRVGDRMTAKGSF